MSCTSTKTTYVFSLLQMHMSFWFGVDLGSFLFTGYNVTTVWALVATCVALAVLAMLYEAMKVSQIHLEPIVIAPMPRSSSSESSSLLSKVTPKNFEAYTRWYVVAYLFEVISQTYVLSVSSDLSN